MKNPRKFAIASLALILVLSACSPQQPTQAETLAAATEPEVETPTLAPPTETAQPTATPTPQGLQLEVIEWYRWSAPPQFEGDIPDIYVEVLVRNPYDFPINVYEPAVHFLNAGEVVMSTREIDLYLYADAGWNMILPGETVPGKILAWPNRFVSELPEWDSFTISADIEEATPIPYITELDIRTGAFTYRENSAYFATFYSHGTVTNTSGQPLKTILLRSIARDASGHFVGSGLIGVIGDFFDGKYQSLEPGGTFEIETLPAYVDPALSAEPLEFEVSGFGIIAKE